MKTQAFNIHMKYCLIVVLASVILSACTENKAEEKKVESPKSSAPVYQFATVESGGVPTTLKLPAQLMAYQEVSLFPKVNGYVKSVLVDLGSHVSKGSLLMELEAPELEQAALLAKEKYAKANADFSIDKEHYQRLLEASKTKGAISPMDLSTIKAKMNADTALVNAEKANWDMQKAMLSYLKVTAPFSGVITERNIHPGALVSAMAKDKSMLELKQIEHLRLQVEVPEHLAVNLHEHDTLSFYVSALQGKKLKGKISRKSSNISSQLRSEKIEVDVLNGSGVLSSGMYADVLLYSKGNKNALIVPKSAVVTSTERKYVLVSTNGNIRKIDVSTGNQTLDRVEVYGDLQSGDQVIINATDEIKETTN
ncbi:efflux RND transporter periplasmic adaptor subunit [Emticicia fontis]